MNWQVIRKGLGYFLLLTLVFALLARWVDETGGEGIWNRQGKVALVRIEGVILAAEDVIEELNEYRDDDKIQAIVLRIDSPGGAVVPSQEIYETVRQVKTTKKVVASMGTVAASGGYYIASAADWVIANPGTLTGSIGVIMEMPNFSGLLEKVGVEAMVIKSGKNKDVGSPFRKMSADEKELLQDVIDDVHSQFVSAVAQSRALDVEEVRALADGRIFTGRQAKEVGLVDALGTLEEAIAKTAELAGIEGKPQIVESRDPYSFFDLIEERLRPKWEILRIRGLHMNYLSLF